MNYLFRIARDTVAFSKKRKRMDMLDNQQSILQSMHTSTLIAYLHESKKRVHGGDKAHEQPRERKDFEKDIFIPLGNLYFQRSHRMSKQSFYNLFFILKV